MIKIKKSDIFAYATIILFAIQFFSNHIGICTFIDNTGLKHLCIVVAIMWGIILDLRPVGRFRLYTFNYEIIRIMSVLLALIFISFIYMAINGFATFWISETYFFIAPPLFVYVIFKKNYTLERFERFLNLFMNVITVLFFVFVVQRLLSGRVLYFSFTESESPFELEIAHVFLLLYIFYTVIGNGKRRIITAICCILAWKRMCLVYLVVFTVLHWKIKNKNVPQKYYVIITALFAVIPALMQIVLTDSFSAWFYNAFGIDLVDFMQFRFQSLTTAFQSGIKSQGLGTYLYVDVPWYGSYVHMNMHNDIVRLYLEVSIIGLVIFLYGMASIARNMYSFLVMVFMFIELAASHMLGNGSVPFWILAYSVIFCFNKNTLQNARVIQT